MADLSIPTARVTSPTKSMSDLVKDNGSPVQSDPDWYQGVGPDDAVRWDQHFPYQLLVVSNTGTGYEPIPGWKFTLPIAPQAISIETPFAMTSSVTLDGMVEEHAGAPVRSIRLSGTMGVLPTRPSAPQRGRFGVTESVLSGSIRAFGTALSAFRQLASTVSGDNPSPINVMTDTERQDREVETGYYQFHLLRRFLEDYAYFKRTGKGRNATLALAIWKDNAVYLVTPQSISERKDVGSPMEKMWDLSLRAWRRIRLDGPQAIPSSFDPSRRDPAALTKVLNSIQDARLVLQGARSTIEALGGDVDRTLFEPLRECALLVKDLIGVPLALADLPGAVAKDARDTILQLIAVGQDVVDAPALIDARFAQARKDLDALKGLLSGEVRDSSSATTGVGAGGPRTPLSVTAGSDGTYSQGVPSVGRTPGLTVLSAPERHYELFSQVRVARLNLPQRAQRAVSDERARVARFGRRDLDQRRRMVLQAGATLSAAVGGSTATYARIYGLPAPTTTQTLSVANMRLLHVLNDAALAIARLAAYGATSAENPHLRGLEQLAARAAASGTTFRMPRSKFPVPMPYGVTLERLAAAYLGDANRWVEIAALNNLRAPYVDEVGWRKTLLAPGAGNVVVVSEDTNIHVGQTVWVSAPSIPAAKRHVQNIVRTPGQVAVTLDGDPNLSSYTTTAAAVLQGFLPNTVNSQMLVYIPSDQAPDGAFRTSGVPEAQVFDSLASIGGIDLLLTPTNDLVVTPDGDTRWAVGMTNLLQRFRLSLAVRRGSLLHHPDFGLGLRVGESTADLSIQDVSSAVRAALNSDPAFRSIRQVRLLKSGPVIQLSIDAEIVGSNITLPLSVDLAR